MQIRTLDDKTVSYLDKKVRKKMGDKELGKVTRYLMAAVLVMWAIAAIIGLGRE